MITSLERRATPALSTVPATAMTPTPLPQILVADIKDLVRGTIYSRLENVIDAYKFFKETPGIEIIGVKEKI